MPRRCRLIEPSELVGEFQARLVRQLEQVLAQPLQPRYDFAPVAAAHALDLLGEIVPVQLIDAAVALPQQRRLLVGPGGEVVDILRSRLAISSDQLGTLQRFRAAAMRASMSARILSMPPRASTAR